jgi:mono/diheme cytochrome c family protein
LSFVRYSTFVTRHAVSKRLIKAVVCGLGAGIAAIAFLPSLASGNRDGTKVEQVEGAKVFADNCVECHAADGHGLMLHQPNFTDPDWQKTVTDDELSKVIKWGREPMPFWVGALSDEQIAAVVRFIRSLGKPRATGDARMQGRAGLQLSQEPHQAESAGSPGAAAAASDQCSACHRKQDEKILSLYSQSAHAKSGKGCNSCHGGDADGATKEEAHSGGFVGKPNSDQAVRMCGSCHRSEAAQYRASRHFPVQKGVSRVDCVECHGAHTVGAPARSYSVAYFCSGCHGLEYLPGLQQQFQDMLKLSDDLRLAFQDFTEAGHTPSDEMLKRRKEIQQLTGEIVHKTDLEGSTARIPHIVELGQQLKTTIGAAGAQKR